MTNGTVKRSFARRYWPRVSQTEANERLHSSDEIVLSSLRTLTALFAVLMLFFAILDPWMLYDPETPRREAGAPAYGWLVWSARDVSAVAVILGTLLGGLSLWLTLRPPREHWANPLTFLVGTMGLVRAVSYVLASPSLLRVQLLLTLLVGAGCVFLSFRWFVPFVVFAVASWYAVAVARAPSEEWSKTLVIVASAIAISAVVITARRRSVMALQTLQERDRHVSDELAARLLRGELLSRISTRFVTSSREEFDRVATKSLQELGGILGVDHAFICRVDQEPLRTSIVYEWAAEGRELNRPQLQNYPLANQPWFCRRFLDSEVTDVPDVRELPDEARLERQLLDALGTKAFLAVPLLGDRELSWGYVGVAHDSPRTAWLAEEINLLRVVGDILLSTMERQRAEQQVRRNEERFRTLFEAELIGMFFADIYGNITEANSAFLSIVGYESSDLPLRWDRLSPPEWHRQDEAAVARLLTDGIDRPWEKEFFHKDGHRVPILIGGAMMAYDRGECVSFILDLSEQRKAEQKIQQLNAELERTARLGVMGEMAAGLAHEVHQPLAAISNFAAGAKRRLARGRLSDAELTEVFSEIVDQSRRAGSVIQNIRSFVKDRHPERRPVDLNAAVQECARLLRFEARLREVEVTTSLADNLPKILTDVTQLSQILLNLMLNSLQAMDDTSQPRRLRVSTFAEGDIVAVEVSDSGHGMTAEASSRIFDQFFTTKSNGLGMGLPISRSIAESHGGRLELAHTGAEGTSFVLRLPVLPAQPFAADGSQSTVESK